MIKAYDWMEPSRGIFDFRKDWGEPRGVKNIFLKSLFLGENLPEKCFFHRKTAVFWSLTWFCNYLRLFYVHLQRKRRKSLSYCEKIQIFDRAETRRTRLSSLTLRRYARKHFGCPQTDFVLNYRYCFLS